MKCKNKNASQKSFFEITEDPPQILPNIRTNHKKFDSVRLPNISYFFIDFTEQCQLRSLKKMNEVKYEDDNPLEMQKYGKHIIINVEDASPLQNQLVKYEEQHRAIRQKKVYIQSKVKQTLQRHKQKFRSQSVMMIKQKLIQEYCKPIKMKKKITNEQLPSIGLHQPEKVDQALKKLGLYKD